MTKKVKCTLCGEKYDPDRDGEKFTFDGDNVCMGCYDSEMEEPSTLFRFGPDGKEKIIFSDCFGFSEDSSPLEKLPEPIESQKWVSTDGCGGYTDWEYSSGYKEITNGWITNFPDDSTSRKIDLSKYFDDLVNEKIIPPVNIYWIFGRTSNVFSSSSSIVCLADDEKTIEKWLDEIDGGIDHFKEMLS
jgi:hypothetical protein